MANLTVSTAVDTFMQAADQAGAQAALALDPTSSPTFAEVFTSQINGDSQNIGIFTGGSGVITLAGQGGLQFSIYNIVNAMFMTASAFYPLTTMSLGTVAAPWSTIVGSTLSLPSQTTGPVLQADSNNNAELLGYNGGSAGDKIGFSAGGVASVTAVADGLQLPITRTAARGSAGLGFVVPAGGSQATGVAVTGVLSTDILLAWIDTTPPGWSGTGGIQFSPPYLEGSEIVVDITNTDLINAYEVTGNLYVVALR